MPTLRQRRRRKHHPHYEHDDFESRPSRRRAPGSRLLLAPFVGLILLVALAPSVVSYTPLGTWLVDRAVTDLHGDLRVGGVSVGWFTAARIDRVELRDDDGELVARLAAIDCDKSLLGMLTKRSSLGRIRIVEPELRLELTDRDTNLERVFAPWLNQDPDQPQDDKASDPLDGLDVELEVVRGNVTIIDTLKNRRAVFGDVNASMRHLATAGAGYDARATAHVQEEPGDVAKLELELDGHTQAADQSTPISRLTLKSEGFPLWIAAAAARRATPGWEADGQLASDLVIEWSFEKNQLRRASIDGQAVVEHLACAGPALNGDRLQLASLRLPIKAAWQDQRLVVDQFTLTCDLGEASFAGTLDGSGGWSKALERKPFRVAGHVDLAKLAAALPRTVRVRDDARITAGRIELEIDAQPRADAVVWQGRLESTQLAAIAAGEQITWDKPMLVTFTAHESADGWQVDQLNGEADFLRVEGSGSAHQGQVAGSFDFDRLAQELSRFVKVDDLRMAGSGTSKFHWRRSDDGRFQLDGQLDAQRFELSRPGAHPWIEPQLQLTLALAGDMDGATLSSVDLATLRLVAGRDRLDAQLEQPVPKIDAASVWPVAITIAGQLERWLPRSEPWIGPLPGYDLAGSCQIVANVTYASGLIELEPLRANVHALRAALPGVIIDEPLVELSANGKWDRDAGKLQISDARWQSASLTAEARGVQVALNTPRGMELQGTIQYSGDVARLWQWTLDPAQPPGCQLGGRMDGRIEVTRTGDVTNARLHTTVNQFLAAWPSGARWQEPQLNLASTLLHDAKSRILRLNNFDIAAQAIACTARGQLSDLSGQRLVELDGRVRYDLAALKPVWQQWTGEGIDFYGRDERPFSLSGSLASITAEPPRPPDAPLTPLVPVSRTGNARPSTQSATEQSALAKLAGNASLKWDRGNLYGFVLGPATIDAHLAGGMLGLTPLDVTASGGRLHLAPSVRLSPGPMELTMPRGRVADQVQITPEMCARALKFVAPILADVTQADGRFSVDLDTCRLPIGELAKGDLAGRVTVHDVSIGPGPLVQELAVLMSRPAPARLMRESVVEFRMIDGRVYHQGLALVFPDFTVKTSGSVGLDESLAIVAELPVPPKWIGNNRLGDALRGQTIRLPIGGTLKAPKIDQAALQQTSARFLRDAAGQAIQGEIINQFDRLLGKPR
ncbi:MAG: hypothetical protein K2Y37_11055 [Pirellulales bacterium]|nr:hypothetical protein [Pirellulales bacterium]